MGAIPWWGWVAAYLAIGVLTAVVTLLRVQQVMRQRADASGGVRWGRAGTGLEAGRGCLFWAMLLSWPVAAPLFARVLFGKAHGPPPDPRRPGGAPPPVAGRGEDQGPTPGS